MRPCDDGGGGSSAVGGNAGGWQAGGNDSFVGVSGAVWSWGASFSGGFGLFPNCAAKKPSQANTSPATPQLQAAISTVPPINGPGYQDGNITQAFQVGNRRGRDPFRKRTRSRVQNADANGGNTNYLLTVPILVLPKGR